MSSNESDDIKRLLQSRDFPQLKNDLILRVARGEIVEKLPIWIMRQAGRYLPEFQELRKLHKFFDVCQTPQLACEVTLMPINRFNLDAAIIFSDIMVIPAALGMEVTMEPNIGPFMPKPLTLDTIGELKKEGAVGRLTFVGDAITLTRHRLDGTVPLIGFTGAPWTLMGYMIEGSGSKTYSKAKRWLYAHAQQAHQVLSLITDVIIDYLVMQMEHGAQILQVFESSGEFLNRDLFEIFCMPYLGRIRKEVLAKTGGKIPMVLFVKGGSYALDRQVTLGYEVLGLDWTVDVAKARKLLPATQVVQGNLDPCALYASESQLRDLVDKMVSAMGTSHYIVNLGHGIYPDAPISSVETFIDAVHGQKIKQ